MLGQSKVDPVSEVDETFNPKQAGREAWTCNYSEQAVKIEQAGGGGEHAIIYPKQAGGGAWTCNYSEQAVKIEQSTNLNFSKFWEYFGKN